MNPAPPSCRAATTRSSGTSYSPSNRSTLCVPTMPKTTSMPSACSARASAWPPDTGVTVPIRSALHHGHRVDHGARRSDDLGREGDEQKLVRTLASQVLEIDALHDVDPVLDEQMRVHGLGIAGRARVGCRLDLIGLRVR